MNKDKNDKPKKRERKPIPSQMLMKQIWEHCLEKKNKRGEIHREIHECFFLLCWKAGLRITEAVYFDFAFADPEPKNKGLFLIKGKGEKERLVYLDLDLIKKLKERNWKSVNIIVDEEKRDKAAYALRISFFRYLERVRKEMSDAIPSRTELAPHTLRRCFATHNADNGMPLSILQRYLGHTKASTTAIYIRGTDKESLLRHKPTN